MRNYFKNLFLFTSYTLLVYFVCLLLWANIPYFFLGSNFLYRQGAYGHLNTRVKEIPKFGEVDILFVGSSRIYRGIDPRIFEVNGFKVFVLGSSSQTPLQSFVLLSRYLDILNPKVVVLDVLPSAFSIKGVEPSLDLLANDRIDKFNWELALKQNDLMLWNTLIYAQVMQVIGKHDDFKESIRKDRYHDTYEEGGFVRKDSTFQKEVQICSELGTLNWDEPLEIQLEYFRKSLKLLEKNQKEVILMNMPLAHYNCYDNNDVVIESISHSITYMNHNNELQLTDKSFYYDEYHLNNKGVAVVCDYLVQHEEIENALVRK